MKTIEATIERIVKRGRNTTNGNPRLIVEILTSSEGYPGRTHIAVKGDSGLSLRIAGGMYVGDETPRTFALWRGQLYHVVE